jgi:hypothetical protein
MADLLTTIRAELDARLSELRPLLAEYERLSCAAEALASEGRAAPDPATARRAPARAARPAPAPRRGPGRPRRGSAAGAIVRTYYDDASPPDSAEAARSARPPRIRERTPRGAAGRAILAALEHGSHTVAELVVVTALPAPDIRHGLRRLHSLHEVAKIDRGGKTAYALPAPAA